MPKSVDNAFLNLNEISNILSVVDLAIHFPPVGGAIMFAEAAMYLPLEDV